MKKQEGRLDKRFSDEETCRCRRCGVKFGSTKSLSLSAALSLHLRDAEKCRNVYLEDDEVITLLASRRFIRGTLHLVHKDHGAYSWQIWGLNVSGVEALVGACETRTKANRFIETEACTLED